LSLEDTLFFIGSINVFRELLIFGKEFLETDIYNNFVHGVRSYKKKNFFEAIKIFTEVINRATKIYIPNARLATYYNYRGCAYYSAKQYERALRDFRRANQLSQNEIYEKNIKLAEEQSAEYSDDSDSEEEFEFQEKTEDEKKLVNRRARVYIREMYNRKTEGFYQRAGLIKKIKTDGDRINPLVSFINCKHRDVPMDEDLRHQENKTSMVGSKQMIMQARGISYMLDFWSRELRRRHRRIR
jgi:tetratricopeptide (TPR) repeat protein